jgi:hypothetical protein
MVARLVARLPAVVASKTYEDDPHSFRSLRKSDRSSHRANQNYLASDAAQNSLLVYTSMYEALALELEQDHKEVLLLALATETADLKKEPEQWRSCRPQGGGKWFNCNFLVDLRRSTFCCRLSSTWSCTGSGKGWRCWRAPACFPRRGAAGAVGWRWPVGGQ